MLQLIGDHLWQSTICVGVAWLLTLALRKNHAGIRFWVWFAASMKFLVPFAALVALGTALPWKPAPIATTQPMEMFELVSQPFSTGVTTAVTAAPDQQRWTLERLATAGPPTIWALGTLVVLGVWLARWRRIQTAVTAATENTSSREWQLLSRLAAERGLAPPALHLSAGTVEPAVVGVRQPVLLWPASISSRLTDAQMEAILAHELAHIARHDNQLALFHMAVQALFWFHPLAWFIGTRLVHERERACDEEVVRRSGQREAYAEGILRTCEHCLESTLPCAAGVTGADLKARIVAIMRGRTSAPLTSRHRVWIAAAAVVVVGSPLGLGAARAARSTIVPTRPPLLGKVFMQAHTPAVGGVKPAFEVASIKPHHPDDTTKTFDGLAGGKVNLINFTLQELIATSYQTQNYRLIGGPDWMRSDAYDVLAKTEGEPSGPERLGMVRQLLADRFKLVMRKETRELPIYRLVVARSDGKLGPQLKPSTCGGLPPKPGVPLGEQGTCGGWVNLANGATLQTRARMTALANMLGRIEGVGRPVIDQTGLTAQYAYELNWTPTQSPGAAQTADAVSVFTALQEQLGLKLEAASGPLEVYVIDSVQRPSDNDDPPTLRVAPRVGGGAALQPELRSTQPRFEVAFEVATLRLSPPPAASISIVLGAFRDGRFLMRNATLIDAVQYAFDLPSRDLVIGPAGSDSLRLDIEALASNSTESSSLRSMVRNLLEDRLSLSTHTEQRAINHLALRVDRDSSGLRVSTTPHSGAVQSPGQIDHKRMPLGMLASLLSRFEQTVVVDRTGLDGAYDVQLRWTPNVAGAAAPDTMEHPSLATALREQLGLRLEKTEAPVTVVVIDSASRVPKPN